MNEDDIMQFPLQASAKSLAFLAGALGLAASISTTALAHDVKREGSRQQDSFDGRGYQGQRSQEDFRADGYARKYNDRQEKKHRKHAKRSKQKYQDHRHGYSYAGHDHGWRHGRRHGRGNGFAMARFDCRPVQNIGSFNGRPARIGGTGCYDAFGQFYIVPRSRYLIHYLYY
jgi:hypothetical protein